VDLRVPCRPARGRVVPSPVSDPLEPWATPLLDCAELDDRPRGAGPADSLGEPAPRRRSGRRRWSGCWFIAGYRSSGARETQRRRGAAACDGEGQARDAGRGTQGHRPTIPRLAGAGLWRSARSRGQRVSSAAARRTGHPYPGPTPAATSGTEEPSDRVHPSSSAACSCPGRTRHGRGLVRPGRDDTACRRQAMQDRRAARGTAGPPHLLGSIRSGPGNPGDVGPDGRAGDHRRGCYRRGRPAQPRAVRDSGDDPRRRARGGLAPSILSQLETLNARVGDHIRRGMGPLPSEHGTPATTPPIHRCL
jgi:hypothetical protein